jgi:hypothetical protein
MSARRILAVLECRDSDAAVCTRAIEIAAESGGYLTLLVVVPTPPRWANAGPYCVPFSSCEALRANAEARLARAVALVPPEIPLLTALECGRTSRVVARRVEAAAHDVVVARPRRRFHPRRTARKPELALAAT